MLTHKQQRFAELVASGKSHQKAAEALGVTGRTGRKWLQDCPELRERILELSGNAQRRAVEILSTSLTSAAETLAELMKPEQPAPVRLGAARAIIADYLSMRQFIDLTREMEAIKSLVARAREVA
jgi:hypothetical protein